MNFCLTSWHVTVRLLLYTSLKSLEHFFGVGHFYDGAFLDPSTDSTIWHKWGFPGTISMASPTCSKRCSELRSSQKEVPHCAFHRQTYHPTVYSRSRSLETRSDFGGFWENRKWTAYVVYPPKGWCYRRTCAGPCLQSLWIHSWETCTNDMEVWDQPWSTL